MNTRKCKQCGSLIHPSRNRNALYCTSKCRELFNNKRSRRRLVRRKPT